MKIEAFSPGQFFKINGRPEPKMRTVNGYVDVEHCVINTYGLVMDLSSMSKKKVLEYVKENKCKEGESPEEWLQEFINTHKEL
jgi:hypothetical protein